MSGVLKDCCAIAFLTCVDVGPTQGFGLRVSNFGVGGFQWKLGLRVSVSWG